LTEQIATRRWAIRNADGIEEGDKFRELHNVMSYSATSEESGEGGTQSRIVDEEIGICQRGLSTSSFFRKG
jgi:hypothetical protein